MNFICKLSTGKEHKKILSAICVLPIVYNTAKVTSKKSFRKLLFLFHVVDVVDEQNDSAVSITLAVIP